MYWEWNISRQSKKCWHYTHNSLNIEIELEYILNSSNEKVLDVYFDNKLNFHTHVDKLCKKAGQKLHALATVSNLVCVTVDP